MQFAHQYQSAYHLPQEATPTPVVEQGRSRDGLETTRVSLSLRLASSKKDLRAARRVGTRCRHARVGGGVYGYHTHTERRRSRQLGDHSHGA